MKKKNAVMLADTRPALVGQMLVQLRETNQDVFDEVIVFDCGLSETDKEIMAEIMPCRFLPYISPLSEILLKSERFQRFSLIMFARYEMFRLLQEYSTIVWIDTDMVIQGSLSELLQETEGCGFSILCEDPFNKSSKNVDYMRTNFFEPVVGYDMNAYLYCTGLIVVRDCLDQVVDYTEWCYNKTIEWADNLNLPDQGVLNALVQEFGFSVKPLGHKGRYGCFPYIGRDCRNALLVHCWGTNKFWNNYYLNKKFPVWEDCYQQWLELGGSELLRTAIPEVSVVIPVYKPDFGYFRQCLDSLQSQMKNTYESYSDFEIIIVAEPFMQTELQSFIAKYNDPRIKLEFNKERLGIAASLNRGMRLAQGKYIARIDDDDIASPDRLAKQAEYLNVHDSIDLCTSDYMYFGDMNEGRRVFDGEMSRAWSVLTCPFDHPTIMFRRDFFVNNDLFYDETRGYVEDWELWQRAFKHGMRVGCIKEILFYHRWHNGSAGQTNKTVDMMRQMIKTNMLELNVEVSDDDLWLLSPWNGKVEDETQRQKLAKYFDNALKNNNKLRVYEHSCLQKAFALRLLEAENGRLSEIIIEQTDSENKNTEVWQPVEAQGIKGLVKRLLKPLYRPFRHRYEDRLIEIQNSNWRNEGHLLNCIEKLDRIVAGQQEQIRQLQESLDFLRLETQTVISSKIYEQLYNTRQELEALLLNQSLDTRQELSAKLFAEAENTRKELSAKLFTEAENTRQELSAKLFTEAENTRQELSAKLFTEAENTRQELSAKLFTEAENTRQELSAKTFAEAENTRQELSSKLFTEAENTRQELSSKLFAEAENTRQELSSKLFAEAENTRQELSSKLFTEAENTRQELSAKLFTEAENTRGFTENKVWGIKQEIVGKIDAGFWNFYYEMNKYKFANKQDASSIYDEVFYWENRYGSVRSARNILGFILKKLPCNSLIDFGCGTGTWLWVAQNYGVDEIIGLDGDYVSRDMLMIPEKCFQPTDLSKPFKVFKKYDMAMSLEVAEHLPEESADGFVKGLCMSSDIVLFSAAHPGQGGDGHINEQPKEYWIEKFAQHNYKPIEIKQYFADDEKVEWWYRDNIVLFSTTDKYEEVESWIMSEK